VKTRHAAPVFQVADLEASLKHYTAVLGFSPDCRFGDYAGVKLGDVCFHLCGHTIHQRPVGGGTVYVFCAEPVDAYYAELTSRGAKLIAPPCDCAYGMRDFMVADPDGNQLAFGCRSEDAPPTAGLT
jgi:predicted enzyme related to lactoylglutathione lyase